MTYMILIFSSIPIIILHDRYRRSRERRLLGNGQKINQRSYCLDRTRHRKPSYWCVDLKQKYRSPYSQRRGKKKAEEKEEARANPGSVEANQIVQAIRN